MKILVVDDDEIVQSMLKNVLMQSGYEVELACDGKQALTVGRFQGLMRRLRGMEEFLATQDTGEEVAE